jgi:hypothetical protein
MQQPACNAMRERCAMSLYKIDGFLLSVDELYTWIAGFVTLYRKGRLRRKRIPQDIVDLLAREKDDRLAIQEVLVYLKQHEDYMAEFIRMVKEATADLAIEREYENPGKK